MSGYVDHGWRHAPKADGGTDPIPAAAATAEEGYSSVINLPVLGLQSNVNNIEASGAITMAIDNGYPHNGYMRQSSDNNYIIWPINLGPQGSWWMPVVLFAFGPDYGICEMGISTAEPEANVYGLPLDGGFESQSATTFVTLDTQDCYAAALDKFPTNSQVCKQFLVTGAPGAVGTAFSGSNTDRWDGGPGPHYFRLKTNGKHASSSSYKRDVSEVILIRLSNDLTL